MKFFAFFFLVSFSSQAQILPEFLLEVESVQYEVTIENYDGNYIADVKLTISFQDEELPDAVYTIQGLEGESKPVFSESFSEPISNVEVSVEIRTVSFLDPTKIIYEKSLVPDPSNSRILVTLGGTYNHPVIAGYVYRD